MAAEAAVTPPLLLPETMRVDKDEPFKKVLHVLAVDDSLVDRKIIERLLTVSSCKVTVVDSGRKALELLGLGEGVDASSFGLKVDLIMTDYCMPGMTGYDLLKKIKESSAFRQVPVVIMSSENVVGRIDRCMEEGAEEFIVKPVKLADVRRIRSSMESKVVKTNKRKEMEGPLMEEVVPLLVMASSPKFLCAAPPPPLDLPHRRPKLSTSE